MRRAIEAARARGPQGRVHAVAMSFVIARHGDDFRALIDDGLIDILFANEAELAALTGERRFRSRARRARRQGAGAGRHPQRQGRDGGGGAASAPKSPPSRSTQVVDTTGAGDLFAAGFLPATSAAEPLGDCLTLGAIAAAEVISHYGARPEADLRALGSAGGLKALCPGFQTGRDLAGSGRRRPHADATLNRLRASPSPLHAGAVRARQCRARCLCPTPSPALRPPGQQSRTRIPAPPLDPRRRPFEEARGSQLQSACPFIASRTLYYRRAITRSDFRRSTSLEFCR